MRRTLWSDYNHFAENGYENELVLHSVNGMIERVPGATKKVHCLLVNNVLTGRMKPKIPRVRIVKGLVKKTRWTRTAEIRNRAGRMKRRRG